MISFEISKEITCLEVYLDSDGVEELIESLKFIKSQKDHDHLIKDIDLSSEALEGGNLPISYVTFFYLDEGESA